MAKLTNISGFPEWLPEQKLVEDRIISKVREVYASFGFGPIETPAVELMTTLLAKGAADKEIYAVHRLEAPGEQEGHFGPALSVGKTMRLGGAESELGLHFDLTVPFARYVAQHYPQIVFPFKRYQLQKVWRGERPQKGRFREFYQFDVDIIARDELPISCDAEILTVIDRAFAAIGVVKHTIRLNNRKILIGFYSSLGLDAGQVGKAIQAVDKLNKIGPDGVRKELALLGLSEEAIGSILRMTTVRFSPASEKLSGRLECADPIFSQGAAELEELLSLLPPDCLGNIEVDLSLARGLDYYTGAIFEIYIKDYPEFGSVGSGGRYDNLASEFIDKKLPGVGATFGLTRFLDLVFKNELISATRKTTAEALVVVMNEDERRRSNEVADGLRAAGVATEVFFRSPKLGKQIDYASAKGIRYVVFPGADGAPIEAKDLETKEQKPVTDIAAWARAIKENG